MRQRLILGVTLLLAIGMAARVAHAEVRLAYVDIQRALNDCRNGKTAKADVRLRVQRVEAQLEGEQKAVQDLKSELDNKGALMQPDQRQNLEDQYARKMRQLQDDYKNSRDELQQRDQQVTGAIVRDLAVVVRQISQKDGYTAVMEAGSLLWASPSIDITDQVVRAYDGMNVKPGALGQEAANAASSQFGAAASRSRGAAAPAVPEAPDVPSSPAEGRSTISK